LRDESVDINLADAIGNAFATAAFPQIQNWMLAELEVAFGQAMTQSAPAASIAISPQLQRLYERHLN
jgi:hypothetical protein